MEHKGACTASYRKLLLQHHGAAAIRCLTDAETHIRESKSDYLAGDLPSIAELIDTILEELDHYSNGETQ